jgi:uncharacterized protein (UPF0548 family)
VFRESDQDLVGRMSRRSLTYPEVGATERDDLPAGYQTLQRTVVLGRGEQVFERAGHGLRSWQMHRRAGIGVAAGTSTAVTGAVAVLVLGRRPIAVTAPCLVVRTTTEGRRCGFAYGTLAGHPESGEESFLVRLEDDDRVTFTLRAFSRPATLLARAGGPVTPWVQRALTRRYLAALAAIAAGPVTISP